MNKQIKKIVWLLLLMLCPFNSFAQSSSLGTLGHFYLNYCGYDEPFWGRACGYSEKENGEYKQKNVSAMVFFPADSVKKFVGGKCAGVRIGVSADVKNAVVFVRRDYRDIGTKLAQKTVDLKTGWNEVVFDTPIVLTEGEGLTVGYDFDNTIQSDHNIMTTDKNYMAPEEACIMSINGKRPELYTRFLGCFFIHAIITDKPEVTENKMTFVSLSHTNIINQEGKINIDIKVKNIGSNKISSIGATMKINGVNAGSFEEQTSIAPLQLASVRHSDVDVKNGQTLIVSINTINGKSIPSLNDTITIEGCLPVKYKRMALVEEFTTEKCGNCPREGKNIHNVLSKDEFRGKAVFVAHHVGYGKDKFTFDFDDLFLGLFGHKKEAFAPSVSINRRTSIFAKENTPAHRVNGVEGFTNYLKEGLEYPASATINLSKRIDLKTKEMHIEVSGNVLLDYVKKDNLYVNIYLVEDNIFTDSQAAAANGYYHQGVIRKVITSPEGTKISFAEDGTYTYAVDTRFPEVSNGNNLRLVAFVANQLLNELPKDNHNICEVYNATQEDIKEFLSVEDLPDNNIELFVVDNCVKVLGNASIEAIYTMDGKIIANDNLKEGVYIVRVVTPGGFISKKLLVR